VRRALLLAAVLLAGCTGPELTREMTRIAGPNPPAIGPRTVLVTIAEPEVIDAVGKAFGQAKGKGQVALAMAENYDGTPCSIIVPTIKGPDDLMAFVTWYHELRHCQQGRWHQ
jgi:hypothetical protein